MFIRKKKINKSCDAVSKWFGQKFSFAKNQHMNEKCSIYDNNTRQEITETLIRRLPAKKLNKTNRRCNHFVLLNFLRVFREILKIPIHHYDCASFVDCSIYKEVLR